VLCEAHGSLVALVVSGMSVPAQKAVDSGVTGAVGRFFPDLHSQAKNQKRGFGECEVVSDASEGLWMDLEQSLKLFVEIWVRGKNISLAT